MLEDAPMDPRASLGHEWVTLQDNYERYEGWALAIKLAAVLVFVAGAALQLVPWLICLAILMLWLQDGIFKTYQSRLGDRLLQLEKQIAAWGRTGEPSLPFQLHSNWLDYRRSTAGLLSEYLSNACRPTVAFPYVVLFAAGFGDLFLG